jgi:hypothetical protein
MVNGWKRKTNFDKLINYKKGDNVLVIEKRDNGYWVVEDEDGYRKASASTSKSEALKKAMKYMRER